MDPPGEVADHVKQFEKLKGCNANSIGQRYHLPF